MYAVHSFINLNKSNILSEIGMTYSSEVKYSKIHTIFADNTIHILIIINNALLSCDHESQIDTNSKSKTNYSDMH